RCNKFAKLYSIIWCEVFESREGLSKYASAGGVAVSNDRHIGVAASGFNKCGNRILNTCWIRVFRCQAIIRGYGNRWIDRKSTRLNSSHVSISYAVFCLKKKNI